MKELPLCNRHSIVGVLRIMSPEWVAHRLATGLPSHLAVPPATQPASTKPLAASSTDLISTVSSVRIRKHDACPAPAARGGDQPSMMIGTEDMPWLKRPIIMSVAELSSETTSAPEHSGFQTQISNADAAGTTSGALPNWRSEQLLTAGTRPEVYVSDQHSCMPRPISHRDMRHVDNDVFGVTRRLHGSDRGIHHQLHPGVAESQGFKPGAYAAQLVRGAPGDPDGHAGLGVLHGWIGPGAGRGAAETAHRYPWREK
jgi:hypothetical protein